MVAPELNPGTVYRVRGEAMLYVRTEQRPGVNHPQHLFIRAARRIVLETWLDKAPPEADLIIDERGRREANEERWLRLASEHDNTILIRLLKQACAWLPRGRADELRQRYVQTRPERTL